VTLHEPAKFVLFLRPNGKDHAVNAYSIDQVEYSTPTRSKIKFTNKTAVVVQGTVASVTLALSS